MTSTRGQYRIVGTVALSAMLLLTATTATADLGGAEVLAGVQAWLDGTHDLRADFEQELVSGALGSGLVESGKLILARPGRMRWDYEKPERKIALIDGDRTRLYIEEDRQLLEGSLADSGGLLPTLFAGERPLSEVFEASLQQDATRKAGRSYRLRLVPRQAAEEFEELVLVVETRSFAIDRAEVLDAAGNRMVYRFSGLKRNRGLDKASFSFETPAGTEIVRQ